MRVRVHPADTSVPLLFLTDPETFQPKLDKDIPKWARSGIIEAWGVMQSQDGMSSIMRRMQIQSMYGHFASVPGFDKTPEAQFVGQLIARKQRQLEKELPTVEPLLKRDFVIDIEVLGVTPRVWRRIRVAGGIKLNVLQDKIISPVMGWERHYHGYYFNTVDGACFGPTESQAIDMMHMEMKVVAMMDDTQFKLGQLLTKPGDKMLYLYDLGDSWRHVVTLVEILPAEESTGACQVLDGAMACPPEDSNGLDGMGCHSYQEFLDDVLSLSERSAERRRKVSAAQKAMNTGPNWQPDNFDIEATRRAVQEALKSKASAQTGQKVFSMPVSRTFVHDMRRGGNGSGASASRGTAFTSQEQPSGGFLHETVRTRKEPKSMAVCGNCGSPNDLKTCTGCRQVCFCSVTCQRQAWKAWHKAECKLATDKADTKAKDQDN